VAVIVSFPLLGSGGKTLETLLDGINALLVTSRDLEAYLLFCLK